MIGMVGVKLGMACALGTSKGVVKAWQGLGECRGTVDELMVQGLVKINVANSGFDLF